MESSGHAPVPLPGFAGSLALSLISLGLVCLVAYLALRFLNRRGGLGRPRGPIRILARCPLEPRRSLYLVETAGRCFLVGVGDGPMTMLADLGALDLTGAGTAADPMVQPIVPGRFSAALEKALGRRSNVP